MDLRDGLQVSLKCLTNTFSVVLRKKDVSLIGICAFATSYRRLSLASVSMVLGELIGCAIRTRKHPRQIKVLLLRGHEGSDYTA